MSYTPTMDELREAWLQAESEERDESTSDDDLRAEFDRALAAHDAEVRASVVTEEPEWEYRAVARELDGDVYDSTGPAPSQGEAIDLAAAHRLLDSNPDMPALVIGTQRRRKAGPWVPVEQGEPRIAGETFRVTGHNPEQREQGDVT